MQNLDIVRNLYGAFAARDRKAILEIFDPNIIWMQNEGFPGGGIYIGAETVIKDVFEPFRIEWNSWEAIVSHYLDAGDAIVAIGEYCGINKTTGKSMKAAFAHVYWVRDFRIIRFQQYTDTLMVVQAMRHDPV